MWDTINMLKVWWMKYLFMDILLLCDQTKLWDFKENKLNPIKHYATFADVKLVNVTF